MDIILNYRPNDMIIAEVVVLLRKTRTVLKKKWRNFSCTRRQIPNIFSKAFPVFTCDVTISRKVLHLAYLTAHCTNTREKSEKRVIASSSSLSPETGSLFLIWRVAIPYKEWESASLPVSSRLRRNSRHPLEDRGVRGKCYLRTKATKRPPHCHVSLATIVSHRCPLFYLCWWDLSLYQAIG